MMTALTYRCILTEPLANNTRILKGYDKISYKNVRFVLVSEYIEKCRGLLRMLPGLSSFASSHKVLQSCKAVTRRNANLNLRCNV